LIAVVTGGKSAASRDQKMIGLLDQHFGVKPIAAKPPIRLASNNKSTKKLNQK